MHLEEFWNLVQAPEIINKVFLCAECCQRIIFQGTGKVQQLGTAKFTEASECKRSISLIMSPYLNRVSLCILALYSKQSNFLSISNVLSMTGFYPIGYQGIL